MIIDGTLIPTDRIAADRLFCSGKHQRHGVNLQVIDSPDGTILWVSGQLPGSTHDTAAARIWAILAALEETGLIALGDKGYHGYDNRAHARLRGPGERANAQLEYWRMMKMAHSGAISSSAPGRESASPGSPRLRRRGPRLRRCRRSGTRPCSRLSWRGW
jgi:hypothetical protein